MSRHDNYKMFAIQNEFIEKRVAAENLKKAKEGKVAESKKSFKSNDLSLGTCANGALKHIRTTLTNLIR